MIVYDLKCSQGHSFEGWFENLADLKRQLGKGLVACPICGDSAVAQVPSSFAIGRAKDSNQPVNQEQVARLMNMAVTRYLKDNFEDVGPRFATEALKIHYGAEKPRNIRGVSTQDEEKMLSQEGVEFFKVAAPAQAQADPTPDTGVEPEED